MPRRDAQHLGHDAFLIDFLMEDTIRFALETRQSGPKWMTSNTADGVPQDVFLDYVLPYSFINEQAYPYANLRWRQKFHQLLWANVSAAANMTAAMHVVANAMPTL